MTAGPTVLRHQPELAEEQRVRASLAPFARGRHASRPDLRHGIFDRGQFYFVRHFDRRHARIVTVGPTVERKSGTLDADIQRELP